MNDGIPKDLCSMVYVTIDKAVSKILKVRPKSSFSKD